MPECLVHAWENSAALLFLPAFDKVKKLDYIAIMKIKDRIHSSSNPGQGEACDSVLPGSNIFFRKKQP
jgi:hypothetical protein